MEIQIGYLRGVDVIRSRDEENVTILLNEIDGNYYGGKTYIKIPAKSYEMLEMEIVEKWLDRQKLD